MRSGPGAPYSFTIQFYHTVLPYSKIDEKDSWWAEEEDNYDYGKDFIVRILGVFVFLYWRTFPKGILHREKKD